MRTAVDVTLEDSSTSREHAGPSIHKLHAAGTLPRLQYLKGHQEIPEVSEYIEADVPEIWLHLAEIMTPMLEEGGIPMRELFDFVKAHVPCEMSGHPGGKHHELAGPENCASEQAKWAKAGLIWQDFFSNNEDLEIFFAIWRVQFTA